MRYDLHTHTLYSDGTLTPAELVVRARKQGVDVLALTDHDTTDGMADAATVASACGLRLIAGVEVSVTWEGTTVHVVGLAVDPACVTMQEGFTRLREFRAWRALEIDQRLRARNIEGGIDYARAQTGGGILARTHFARFLVARGHARDFGHAFKRYLGKGAMAYVPGQWAALAEAVGWISAAGGVAVIAHPARYQLSSGKLRRLLVEFRECGGRGIEVISGSHSADENRRFAEVAREHNLLGSVGSDYHGPDKPWVELGRLAPLPETCTPVWTALAV